MTVARPAGRPAMRMQWRHLLFMHWPVEKSTLRSLIPDSLEIDTFDDRAWVGLIPFTMRGVWFFSLDASSRLAVWGARTFWHLNYVSSRMSMDVDQRTIHYTVDRRDDSAHMRCVWRTGADLPSSSPGDLAHFLTERYQLYAADSRGRLYRSCIRHIPWPLCDAEVLDLDDGLVRANGIEVDGLPPIVFAAHALDVHAWPLERVARENRISSHVAHGTLIC